MPRLARREVIDADSIGVYHIQQRCCRRQFLCGVDELTGKDYSFRKEQIQKRIEYLGGLNKGVGTQLPGRPFGCFAQLSPDPFIQSQLPGRPFGCFAQLSPDPFIQSAPLFNPPLFNPDCWLSPVELAKEVADETKHRAIFRASHKGCLPVSLADYLSILDWTGRQIRGGKASIPSHLAPIFERLGLVSDGWVTMVTEFGKLFRGPAGKPTSLRESATKQNRQRVHSLTATESLFTGA